MTRGVRVRDGMSCVSNSELQIVFLSVVLKFGSISDYLFFLLFLFLHIA